MARAKLFDLLAQPLGLRLLLLLSMALLFQLFDFSGLVIRLGLGGGEGAAPPGPLVQQLVRLGLAGLVTLNFWAVTFLPRKRQIIIAWVELTALFFLFFYSFDLKFEIIEAKLPFLLGLGWENGFLIGAALTLFICAVSLTLSFVLALIAALARLSKSGLAVGIASFYISFFRGTPLLLQILLIYKGLPELGYVISAIPSAILALTLCYGAYMAEIFRAGIQAIPHGQREAAQAMGLTDAQAMRLVVLPQAIRLIIPPTGNQFIAMLKDSSLVSVLGAWELMRLAQIYGRQEFRIMEMLISAAVIYWGLSAVFEIIQARIERHYGKGVDPRRI